MISLVPGSRHLGAVIGATRRSEAEQSFVPAFSDPGARDLKLALLLHCRASAI